MVEYYWRNNFSALVRRTITNRREEPDMGVIPLVSNDKPEKAGLRYWLRRQAMNIVNQLPEDHDQAVQVLEYALQFHREMLDRD